MPVARLWLGLATFMIGILGEVAVAGKRRSLDFGWRFHLGDPTGADLCPATAFEDFNGTFCEGWGHVNPHGGLALEFCRLACCGDPACGGFTYSKQGCYMGGSTEGCVAGPPPPGQPGGGTPNVGGRRAVPARPVLPPSDGPQSIGFDDAGWRALNVPHDFVVEQITSSSGEGNHGYRARNVSWYRTNFSVESDERSGALWLEFDGVYRAADFWLNGVLLGHHTSGYTGFRFDLDEVSHVKLDGTPNLLVVRVDPRADEGWFYEGGGIYRHVWLRSTATPAHIAPWGVYVPSEVDAGSVQRLASGAVIGSAKVMIMTDLDGLVAGIGHTGAGSKQQRRLRMVGDAGSDYVVQSNISDHEGNLVWYGSVAVAAGSNSTTQVAQLSEATLWMPGKPGPCGWPGSCQPGVPAAMYSVTTTLKMFATGNPVDSEVTRFGIRSLTFDPDRGLLVNGFAVKAKGMCNHQDFAGVGTAVPDRVQAFRVAQMQAYGVNAWRTAHNPPNPELLDALDDAGVLVMNENRNFGNHSTWLADFAAMLKRDRNHPSVVWWSVCNEIGCKQATGDATLSVGKAFKRVLRQHDPIATRPMTGAWKNWGYGNTSMDILWGTTVVDVSGWNYMSSTGYDAYHNATHMPMVASEHCSCQSDRTAFPNTSDRILGAEASWSCIKSCWEPVANRSFVQGFFDWTGFDYRGENHWPETNAQFGMLDLAGYPKASAYYYREQFLPDTPVVHIVPGQWEASPKPAVPPTKFPVRADQCRNSAAAQAFDFTPAAAAAAAATTKGLVKVVSRSDRSKCLQYDPVARGGSYAHMAPCVAGNTFQEFLWNGTAQTDNLMWVNASGGNPTCLDVWAGTGPDIDFYTCQRGNKNQHFSHDEASGSIQLANGPATAGQCLTFDDGKGQQVLVFTNGDSVELLLNGQSVGIQAVAPYDKAGFTLEFSPGNITAVATKDGKPWGAVDTHITGSAPDSIALHVDTPSVNSSRPLVADGQDVVVLTATVLDTAGHVVHTAQPTITVAVSGDGVLMGLGNGDPHDHTPEGRLAAPSRRSFNGLLRILVETTTAAGNISVVASAPGLKSSNVTVVSVQP